MLQIWGYFVPTPLERSAPNLACLSRPMVYTYSPNFIRFGIFFRPWEAERQFYRFFQMCHSVMNPSSIVETKLNAGAHLQSFPYPAPWSFSNSNALMAKWRSQTLSFKSATDIRTKKKTKTSKFFAPGDVPCPSRTKLGFVIQQIRSILAPLKYVRLQHIVSL